jgi:hypothetical protein
MLLQIAPALPERVGTVLTPEVVTILEFVMICESMDIHLGAASPQTQQIYYYWTCGFGLFTVK